MRNLDRLHGSVQSVMPKASMPSFTVVAEGPGRIEIDYVPQDESLEDDWKFLRKTIDARLVNELLRAAIAEEAEQI